MGLSMMSYDVTYINEKLSVMSYDVTYMNGKSSVSGVIECHESMTCKLWQSNTSNTERFYIFTPGYSNIPVSRI